MYTVYGKFRSLAGEIPPLSIPFTEPFDAESVVELVAATLRARGFLNGERLDTVPVECEGRLVVVFAGTKTFSIKGKGGVPGGLEDLEVAVNIRSLEVQDI